MLRSMLLAALLIFVAMPSEARARPIDETPDWGWRHDVQKPHKIAGWKVWRRGTRSLASSNEKLDRLFDKDSNEFIYVEKDCGNKTNECITHVVDRANGVHCFARKNHPLSCVAVNR